jgi:antitoxin component YwqK of YwqJK toxin-antitoxin module
MNKQLIFLFITVLFTVNCKSQINQLDEQGRRHGHWKVDFEGSSNPKFEGTFSHGKETGTFKFYKKGFYDHPAAIMEFRESSDTVDVTYYTQLGKPISKGKMLDRKREGEWLYFHQESDSIMMSEIYHKDTLNGLQKTYFTNGRLAEKTEYKDGLKHGSSEIYTDKGQITKDLHYKNGELHGKATYYNDKGEKLIEGTYIEGKKTGNWKYFSEGKLEREEDY